jgi:hypothetical protein
MYLQEGSAMIRLSRKLKALGIAISSLFTNVTVTRRVANYNNIFFSNKIVRKIFSLFYDVRLRQSGKIYLQLKVRHRG